MKKTIFLFVLAGLLHLSAFAQTRAEKEYILILHSLNFSEVSTYGTYEALQYAFSKEGIPVKKEALSITLIKDTTEAASKRTKLTEAYPTRPKMVVCIGDPAWMLVRPLFDAAWKEVPVLLCYSKDYVPQQLDILLTMNIDFEHDMVATETITTGYNLTRIKQPVFIDETIATMKELLPHLKNITYICDSRYASVRTCVETREVIETRYPDLNFEILASTDISTERLLNIVSDLDDSTGLIYYSWFIPRQEGYSEYLADNLNKLTHSFSNIPVFSLLDMNTARGNFAGGHYISIEDFSNTAVATAKKIISGTAARDIPVQTGGTPQTYLNYQHLLTHNVASQLYPNDAVYYQTPPSFFSEYKFHLIAFASISFLLFIIGSLRLRLYAQKQKMHDKIYKAALITESLNRKYRLVLKSSETTAWEWDINKKELYCEREFLPDNSAHSNNRYTVPESDFYARIHPDDVWKVKKIYDCLTSGNCKIHHEEIRIKLSYAPQVYNWVEYYAITGEKDENGVPLTLVGGLLVITERKMIEEELRRKEQEERANQLKAAFLANISHEIRTPLNAIVGFSSLIAHGECDTSEAAEYSKIIELNNALLLQLIEDVLELSKIDSGEINIEKANIKLSDMIYMLCERYKSKISDGVTISYDIPEQPFVIYSDKERIIQVLKSFLSNACKFTTVGSIQIGYRHEEDGCYFYVSDTGKGISPENLPHVFERFSKFDSFIQGTGLGLSVSQAIVQKMNGRIGAESELGKGSTFWFSIPCEVAVSV